MCRLSGSLRCMMRRASARACAAPPMSFFIRRMPSAVLMSRPPVSKHTPLPTMAMRGFFGLPQVISSRRGARAAARPTAWIAGKFSQQQLVADPLAEFAAEELRLLARGRRELLRAHVLGGRVHEVAHQALRLGELQGQLHFRRKTRPAAPRARARSSGTSRTCSCRGPRRTPRCRAGWRRVPCRARSGRAAASAAGSRAPRRRRHRARRPGSWPPRPWHQARS